MKLQRKIFLSVLFFYICLAANSQSLNKLELLTQADDFQIRERVLFIPDQELYLAGESINFQAILFDAALQIPIDISSVLYVELFDQNNHVVCAKKFLLKKGETINSIPIPRLLQTDYYYLRAYTNYMKNFGAGAFFTKRIEVINPFLKNSHENDTIVNSEESTITICAEGGKILNDVENKIAFFGTELNSPVHASLYENGTVIADIDSPTGVGVFSLTPSLGNTYKIEALHSDNKKTTIQLNNIIQSGVICKLDSLNNRKAYLKVLANKFDLFPISIFVQNNNILYKYDEVVNQPGTSFNIDLPTGLNTVILKSRSNNVVSSRNIYINPKSEFKITALFDTSNATSGDSIRLSINSDSKDSIQCLIALNLGNSKSSPSLHEFIEASLLKPSIATLSQNITVNELDFIAKNLNDINDYLLKFQDFDTLSCKQDNYFYLPEISNDIVSGFVVNEDHESVVCDKQMYLSFVDSICWVNHCKTDSTGRFICRLPLEYQGDQLIVSVNDTSETCNIKMDSEFYPYFVNITKESYHPDSSLKEIIEARMLNLQVNDAYSKQWVSDKTERRNLKFYGFPSAQYSFSKYVKLPTLGEFIFEVVNEAVPTKKGQQARIRILSDNNKSGENPLLIFDGVPILNINQFVSLPCNKLKTINIISTQFFFGTDIYDGIVDVTSIDNDFGLVDLDKNAIKVDFCPTIAGDQKRLPTSSRIPNYMSNAFFQNINIDNNEKTVFMQLPNNLGNYTLSIFGLTKNGEWSGYFQENAINIH